MYFVMFQISIIRPNDNYAKSNLGAKTPMKINRPFLHYLPYHSLKASFGRIQSDVGNHEALATTSHKPSTTVK